MSSTGDQQRRPGAPDDSDGKRRLRTVSTYPDPYLVTKLPLESRVNDGIIRLGEKTILGFIHRPFPEGTRVRVVYDDWLFAERIDEPEGKEAGGEEAGGKKAAARAEKPKGKGARGKKAAAPAEKSEVTSWTSTAADDDGSDPFPEDLTESHTPGADRERNGKGDSWTDAFRDARKAT